MMRVHREAILSKAAGHYRQSTLDAWALGPAPDRVARAAQQTADPGFIVLVAEAGDEIVGYGVAVPSREQLRALCVKPNAIGRVGSALLGEMEKRAFATAEVLTCDASLNAVAFYRANGYAEQGRVEHVVKSGASVACVRMKKVRPAAPRSE
jgi:ribosomal protein S18 acetylase RimI-like enzyme